MTMRLGSAAGRGRKDDHKGNRVTTGPRWQDPHPPTIKKVAADSVPYGESSSRNGRTVAVAYDGERLVYVAATAKEARRKYRSIQRGEG